MSLNIHTIGFGTVSANIKVYIENIPPLPEYQQLEFLQQIKPDEISNIAHLTGNHWRKIFNVYAKLVFELNCYDFSSWQALRDNYLLQGHSNESLLFSPLTEDQLAIDNLKDNQQTIHIIMGKTYAKKLKLDKLCHWLSEDFAVNESKKLIICPYFDYRQLSNIKISQLTQLIKQLNSLQS